MVYGNGKVNGYSPAGNGCSACGLHDSWCEHIQPPERVMATRMHLYLILRDRGEFKVIVDGQEVANFRNPSSAKITIDGVTFDMIASSTTRL